MTVADILKVLGFAADGLADYLRAIATKFPELEPTVAEWLAKLEAPLSGDNLVAVFKVLPEQLLNIVQGKLDPRPHPSDGA